MIKTKTKFKKNPLVSIIIPLHWGLKPENFSRFLKDLKSYKKMKYENYEVLVVTDKPVKNKVSEEKVKWLVMNSKHSTTGTEKRDFALKYAKGEFCAFIDDDAYPDPNWITNSIPWFSHNKIVAVGGPGITPPENSFWQKVGGNTIESYLCSGSLQFRFYPGFERFVDDQPGYNLLIRTSTLRKVGGWGTTFYGGEDTVLCMKLIREGKILYDPHIVVYHHRRSFPWAHMKQIASVGKHRGYFFKKYPETSRSILYLTPTILTVGFMGGVILSFLYPYIFAVPFIVLLVFMLAVGFLSVYVHKVGLAISLAASVAIIVTHLTYGAYFVRGLLTPHMDR